MDYLTLALVLFSLGIILLLAEVLLPTGGFLVVGSLLFFALGVGIILARGTVTEAVVAVAALAVGFPAAGYVAVAAYKRMSVGGELESSSAPLEVAGQTELEALKNRTGKTVSPMRPSGTVEFDGRRIDAMTEGVMLDAGVWVRCVAVKGTTVLVRGMDPPADVADIDGPIPDDNPAPAPNIKLEAAPNPPASPPPVQRASLDDFDLDIGLDK
ncbi:NfeD family protein [Gemmata sp.]|uniref:NfeD family protein n=1 Tax=Gemmata sp. TaxID=1914242 RepID=UPI003F6FC4D0